MISDLIEHGRIAKHLPLGMNGEIATGLQDRHILAGEGPVVERVDIAILNLLRLSSGRPMSLHLGERVVLVYTIGP